MMLLLALALAPADAAELSYALVVGDIAAQLGGGIDLGLGFQPLWYYDMGIAVLRTDLDVRLPEGLIIGVDLSRFEAAVSLGAAL